MGRHIPVGQKQPNEWRCRQILRRCCALTIFLFILFDAAIMAQERVLQTAEDYYRRGISRHEKADYEGAIEDYTKAISLNPNYAQAYYQRGLARANKNDFDGAIADYDKAIALNPKSADAYYYRSAARFRKDDLDGAIVDNDKAAALDPYYASDTLLMVRGIRRYERRDYDGAISDFNRALAINPEESDAYLYRGNAREAKGDVDGAIADYNKAITSDPDNAKAYYSRGLARRNRGDYGASIADYIKAINLDADFADAYNNLAWLLATSPRKEFRDGKRAVGYARKACELSKWKDPTFLDTLAAANAEMGDFQQAIEWEEKALESPDFSKDEGEKARKRLDLYRKRQPYREQ